MERLLKRLSEAYGPSGREDGVRAVIRKEIGENIREVFVDALGNLVAFREGRGRRIMVAAHMDEIGIIATHADDNGFLRFAVVGGVHPVYLAGKRFTFPGGVSGIAGVEKPGDLKELDVKKMYLDIGAAGREEALSRVSIGEMGVFESAFAVQGPRYSGKAMDDRVGCAILLQAMKEIQTDNEIYFVFTVQEEVGLRGARTAAYRLNPEIGLAVDVTRTGDTPEANKMAVSLGKGPTVKVKDSSVISHPWVRDKMAFVAEKKGIPFQWEVLERGGTDAGSIHITREGIPSGVMSIPARYIHTASEMVDAGDVARGVEFLVALLENPWTE